MEVALTHLPSRWYSFGVLARRRTVGHGDRPGRLGTEIVSTPMFVPINRAMTSMRQTTTYIVILCGMICAVAGCGGGQEGGHNDGLDHQVRDEDPRIREATDHGRKLGRRGETPHTVDRRAAMTCSPGPV